MQLLISDANILIDLEEGLLIEAMFQLQYQFATPDILFHEELLDEHEHLLRKGLVLRELSSSTMTLAAESLIPTYTGASRNDCFALALAKQESCPLLSGDKNLRKAAAEEAVPCMGTIWLIEQMIGSELITTSEARHAFKLMQAAARRLPWEVAESRLVAIEKELSESIDFR